MNLKVSGQSIEWLDQTLTVSGSDGIYQIEFTFVDVEGLPSWSDLSKYAVFKNTSLPQYDNGVYAVITDGVADIPACILTEPGKLSVGVYGQNGYYTMPTIWAEPVKMQAGCAEGEAAVPSVMTSAQNAIKYGENAKVFTEGGYPVRKVGGTVDDPEIERLPDYVKGAKQYAQEAARSAESAAGDAEDAARDALKSEGYAVGEQDGEAVASGSPYYQNNAKYYNQQAAGHDDAAGRSANAAAGSATSAGNSAAAALASAKDSEAYAIGKRAGADVPSTDPAYHNNAKYYNEQAAYYAAVAQTVVDSNFLLVNEDEANQKYMISLFIRGNQFGAAFTAVAEE